MLSSYKQINCNIIIYITYTCLGEYLEFLDKESNFLLMPRCDDCNSDAIDLSANPVPFGEYYHSVAHVSATEKPVVRF